MSIVYKREMIRLSEWERIRDHFPEENIPDGRPGRKPVPTRQVLEAVLWILNTGVQWYILPQCYPNYKTVYRRFQTWCRNEVLRDVLTDIANELRERGAHNRPIEGERPYVYLDSSVLKRSWVGQVRNM